MKNHKSRLLVLLTCLLTFAASAAFADVITYTAVNTYTWTCPPGVTNVQVECWGGGGTGASSRRPGGSNGYGGGGGGGAYARTNVTVVPGNSYTVFVGGGGQHTTATINATGVPGASGTNSWFGTATITNCLAVGGAGAQDAFGNSSTFGAGGLASACIGTPAYSGGNGQSGSSPNGGGGGSSAGNAANGVAATTRPNGGIAPAAGGNGGTAGNATAPKAGSAGSAPGGGGGGAVSTGTQQNGGDGANGQVKLTYTVNYDHVNVETAADGSGSIVPAQNISSGSSITAYAIGRASDNSFISNAPAAWSLVNKTGGVVDGDLVVAGDSKSATFTAHVSGGAIIQAVIGTATTNASGLITVPATGVVGVWTNDVDGNWTDATKWDSNPSVPSVAGDTAILGAGTALRTVTLDANETVGSLDMTNANSFVVSGGNTLTLDNSGAGAVVLITGGSANAIQTSVALNDNAIVAVGSGKSLTVSGIISNSTGVNKTLTINGAGTNILSAANTYGPASAGTVGTILSGGGTVQLGNSTALGAGDITNTGSATIQSGAAGLSIANNIGIVSGATATVDNNGNNLTLSGVISGGGSLAKTSNGKLTLSGVNSYAGSTTVANGVLSIADDSNIGTAPGSATPNSLVLGSSTSDLLITGSTTLNANRGVGLGASSGSTGSTALIDVASSQAVAINGIIASAGNTGTNGLTINSGSGNTGTLTLGGANTFNGTTLISAGTLTLGNSLALQNSTLNYISGTLGFGSLTAATLGGLSGSQNLALLNGSSAAVALTVGGNNVSNNFSGGLSGTGASLTKTGTATFTLSGNNTYSGNSTVSGGILEIAAGGSVNCGGVFAPAAGSVIRVNGGSLTANSGSSIGTANSTSARFDLLAGSATFNAGVSGVNQDGQFFNITGGNFTSTDLTLNRAQAFNTAPTVATPIAGSTTSGLYINGASANVSLGTLNIGVNNSSASVRLDAGTLTASGRVLVSKISGGSSRWSILQINGGTFTNTDTANGIVIAANNGAACNGEVYLSGGTTTAEKIAFGVSGDTLGGNGFLILGGGNLYLGSGGIVQSNTSGSYVSTVALNSGILGAKADWSSTNPMTLGGATIQAADALGAAHDITLSGQLGGTTLTKTGNGTLTLNSVGNFYTGLTTVNAGTLNINSEWALGGANYNGLTMNGGTLQYAATLLNGVTDISTKPVTIAGNATIDVNGNSVSFANGIGNGGVGGLTIASTAPGGVLSLNGAQTYTGNTTVASGTLAGNGTIISPTTVSSGGTLSPGLGGIDTSSLLISNNLTLAGNAVFSLNRTNAQNSTRVSGITNLTYGGTLTVNNAATALQSGDTFTLFSAATTSGSFAATNLPALTSGLKWVWDPANGQLSVAASVNTASTNITTSISGNTLTLAWPADHTGWRLQVQTNDLSTGLSGNWSDVPGATGTNSVDQTINPANGAVFYRLVYP